MSYRNLTGRLSLWSIMGLAAAMGLAVLAAGCEREPDVDCSGGLPGCECSEDECAGTLVCSEGLCTVPGCVEGEEGCPCGAGCGPGLVCNELSYCQSVAGQIGEACFANRTCLPGAICGAGDICERCSAGTQGCVCYPNDTCAEGFDCVLGICSSAGSTSRSIPSDPKCHTPCESGFVDANGAYRACSVEGLMEGCLDDAECVNGSCVMSGASAPTCATDVECPEFQVCINGACYSDCEVDADCGGMMRCHMNSCRVPCSATDSTGCGLQEHCELLDAEFGFCMPAAASTQDTGEPPPDGTFTLGSDVLQLSNTVPTRIVTLSHESPRVIEFTIRKLRHRVLTDGTPTEVTESPLPWLSMGTEGGATSASEVVVRVPPETTVKLEFTTAATGTPSAWSGAVEVDSELGRRTVTMTYAASPEGRWGGKAYYFSQFGDHNLEQWLAGTSLLDDVGNALIQKWGLLKRNDGTLPLIEFDTILSSTLIGSWSWPSTKDGCNTQSGACYPSVNTSAGGPGLGVFSWNLGEVPVPSGVMELPISLNIEMSGETTMVGRIDSDASLHYPGNPRIDLAFELSPESCSAQFGENCAAFLTAMDATIAVGGRYPADSGCATGYAERRTPWLVPGFEQGTSVDPENGGLYREECRNTATPFAGDGAASENVNLAMANPIPDGRARVRTIELVDGALLNQDRFIIFFRETFQGDFLGAGGGEPFSAYGVMVLSRVNTELEQTDFVGYDPAIPSEWSYDLSAAAACPDSLLSDFGLSAVPANAVAIAKAMLDGVPAGASKTPIPAGEMHYLCHETGHFDRGALISGAATQCPASSQVTYFQCRTPGICGDPLIADSLADQPCQPTEFDQYGEPAGGTCGSVLEQWLRDGAVDVLLEPPYSCADGAYCDEDRGNLLDGKDFFEPIAGASVVMHPILQATDRAFIYKTQFRNREGTSVGFTPTICAADPQSTPYCYDPERIQEVASRTNCLAFIVSDSLYRAELESEFDTLTLNRVLAHLRSSFSMYDEDGPARTGAGV